MITFDRSLSLHETYYFEPCWEKFRSWLKYNYGSFQYITVVEQHQDGFPHINVLVHNSALNKECEGEGWKDFHQKVTSTKDYLFTYADSFETVFSDVDFLKKLRKQMRLTGRQLSTSASIEKITKTQFHVLDEENNLDLIVSRKDKKSCSVWRSKESLLSEWGIGQQFWVEPMRDSMKMSKYLAKKIDEMSDSISGELAKDAQLPIHAPKYFRRIRASKGLIEPEKSGPNPDYELRIVKIPFAAAKKKYQEMLGFKNYTAREVFEADLSQKLSKTEEMEWRYSVLESQLDLNLLEEEIPF